MASTTAAKLPWKENHQAIVLELRDIDDSTLLPQRYSHNEIARYLSRLHQNENGVYTSAAQTEYSRLNDTRYDPNRPHVEPRLAQTWSHNHVVNPNTMAQWELANAHIAGVDPPTGAYPRGRDFVDDIALERELNGHGNQLQLNNARRTAAMLRRQQAGGIAPRYQLPASTIISLRHVFINNLPAVTLAHFPHTSYDQIPSHTKRRLTPATIAQLQAAPPVAVPPPPQRVLMASDIPNLQVSAIGSVDPKVFRYMSTGILQRTLAQNPNTISSFSTLQIARIVLSVFRQSTTAELFALRSTLLARLGAPQVAAIQVQNIAQFTAAEISQLPAAFLDLLTVQQVTAIPNTTLSNLTTAQISQLPAAFLGNLNAQQMASLSGTEISNLTAAEINSHGPSASGGFGRTGSTGRNSLPRYTEDELTAASALLQLPSSTFVTPANFELTLDIASPAQLRVQLSNEVTNGDRPADTAALDAAHHLVHDALAPDLQLSPEFPGWELYARHADGSGTLELPPFMVMAAVPEDAPNEYRQRVGLALAWARWYMINGIPFVNSTDEPPGPGPDGGNKRKRADDSSGEGLRPATKKKRTEERGNDASGSGRVGLLGAQASPSNYFPPPLANLLPSRPNTRSKKSGRATRQTGGTQYGKGKQKKK
jgi:hypothetical protein